MAIIPFPQAFPKDERAEFYAVCRKYGLSPFDFLPKGAADLLSPPAQRRREVLVFHVPTGSARRYEAGLGARWTMDFENDIADGRFLSAATS